MTFLELCQAVVTEVGLSGQIQTVNNQRGDFARIVSFVRASTSQVEGKWINWRFLHGTYVFQTTQDINTYTAPADLRVRQWDLNRAFLEKLAIRTNYADDLIHYERDPLAEDYKGRPVRLIVERNNALRFIGTPDDEYEAQIEYYRMATILQNNEDTPAVPEQFQRIIIAESIRRYANYDEAAELKQQALEELYGVGGNWVNPEPGSWLYQLQADQLPYSYTSGATDGGQFVVRPY